MSKKIISFEKLLEISIDDMKIICNNFIQKKLGLNTYCLRLNIFSPNDSICREYYCYRNYFEVREFFELFTKKFPDIKFPDFPHRLIFTKAQEESRMKYFQMFLNKILEEAKNETKTEEILDSLYNLFFGAKDASVEKLTKEKIKQVFNKDVADEDIIDEDNNTVEIEENQSQSNVDSINNISALIANKNNSNFLEILNSEGNKNNDNNIKAPTLDNIISPEENKFNNSVNLNLSFTATNENNISANLNTSVNLNNSVNVNNTTNPNNTNNTENPNSTAHPDNNSKTPGKNKTNEKEGVVNLIKRNTLNYVNEKFNYFLGNKSKETKEKKEKKENKEKKESETKGIFDGFRKTISSSKKVSNFVLDNNIWENIYVKTPLKDFCLHQIKIIEKILILSYEENNDQINNNNINEEENADKKVLGQTEKTNDFYLIIPLYKINMDIFRIVYPPLLSEDKSLKSIPEYYKKIRISSSEIYELEKYAPNASLSEINSEILIKLYHDYDRFETFIKFGPNWRINSVKSLLSKIEECSIPNKIKSLYIEEIIESNMDSFGNIMIDILNFNAPHFKGKIKIKICLEPYSFFTKSIISDANFEFNQKFLIPKHNRFMHLKFYIYKTKEGGLIIKKDADKLISTYEIPLPKLINIYHLNKDPIEINLKPVKEKAKKKKLKYTNMTLKFKCIDYSSLLSVLVKNTNKRILDNYPLYNKEGDSEEPYTLKTLLKRIKRVLAWFDTIYDFYKMLKFFKYPITSILFWILLIVYTFWCNPRHYMTHWVVFILIIIIYYSSVFQTYIFPKLKPILIYVRNKYDTPTTLAITEKRKNRNEVNKSDYLIKKKGFSIPTIKDIKEIKHTYTDLIFRLTRVTIFFEKFKNLFLWTDPLLSLYMTIILMLFCLIIWKIEFRFLFCFSVSKKLFFGIFYYKNKFINNKEIARIVTNDAFEIWKKEKLLKEKDDKKGKKEKKDKNNKEPEKKPEKKIIITIMEKKTLDNEKLKNILKTKLYEHCNIILDDKFFEKMETLGDVIEELGKIEDILKIKRLSYLYNLTKNNPKIFQKDIDPEDIFYYFIQNIKSDYYMAQNGFSTNDYFKNDNIIENVLEQKTSDGKNSNGNIPENLNNKVIENKQKIQ